MEVPTLPGATTEANDVFSISDQALSDRLQFIQEIGFGNWGSVWLCRPKLSASPDGLATAKGQKIAVKLVHRSKTSTTAARVRSLWNEMKIVRTFKDDQHPSIIPFHSFVLTPSYALITMTYLPTLVPVEVEEPKAREWFRFLLSGIEFLHRRGVVHNDIKPANILLSHKNIPVLVDFGFAEKYDLESPTAFHSNLSYGTPEYLSPERARGLPHDTRKSDIWSLGITFFEILIGRTPFENTDGEQLSTKDDLEKYWHRTLCGDWIGDWKMSNGVENLLKRMIAPDADLRCTASQAIADEMWRPHQESTNTHRRSASYTSSVIFEKDVDKLHDMTPSSKRSAKRHLMSPPGLGSLVTPRRDQASRQIIKSRSQPKVATNKGPPPKKRPHVPPIPDLSPIKASPSASPLRSVSGKENAGSPKGGVLTPGRRPFGILAARHENLPQSVRTPVNGTTKEKVKTLGDVISGSISRRGFQDVKDTSFTATQRSGKESTSVRDRVRDWERERERLRAITRLEEFEKDTDEEAEREEKQEKVKKQRKISARESVANKENYHGVAVFNHIVLPSPAITPPLTQETPSRRTKAQGKKTGHGFRASIDKTLQIYKSSSPSYDIDGCPSPARTPARSLDIDIKNIKHDIEPSRTRGSSQGQSLANKVNSSLLPGVHNTVQSEKAAADARMDRLALWMQNVERVVEDARQNFAATAKLDAPLPSLPAAPRNVSHNRSTRSSRPPRKVLATSQIFADYNNSLMADTLSSANSSALATSTSDVASSCSSPPTTAMTPSVLSAPASAEPIKKQSVIPEVHTPSRQRRRATVSTNSPISIRKATEVTPSKRREKSRSHGNFLQQRIASITQLEAEINKPTSPEPNPRLSEMFDRNIFIATPIRPCDKLESPRASMDDLTSSPCHVEPYPQRKIGLPDTLPDTPNQRRVEGVYDRFLMATSGVKRVGKGYQSDYIPPRPSTAGHSSYGSGTGKRQSKMFFKGSKTPMPPPISSEDIAQRRGVSIDEMGVISYGPVSTGPESPELNNSTTSFMMKAIKAMVPSSKKLSKMIVA